MNTSGLTLRKKSSGKYSATDVKFNSNATSAKTNRVLRVDNSQKRNVPLREDQCGRPSECQTISSPASQSSAPSRFHVLGQTPLKLKLLCIVEHCEWLITLMSVGVGLACVLGSVVVMSPPDPKATQIKRADVIQTLPAVKRILI